MCTTSGTPCSPSEATWLHQLFVGPGFSRPCCLSTYYLRVRPDVRLLCHILMLKDQTSLAVATLPLTFAAVAYLCATSLIDLQVTIRSMFAVPELGYRFNDPNLDLSGFFCHLQRRHRTTTECWSRCPWVLRVAFNPCQNDNQRRPETKIHHVLESSRICLYPSGRNGGILHYSTRHPILVSRTLSLRR